MSHNWSEQEDAELVDAYRTRAIQAAFSELVRRYQKRLFAVLLGMVSDPELAEELCQQALVKAALNLDQLHDSQAFYGWLLRVARTVALDELKKYARRKRDPFEEGLLGSVNHRYQDDIKKEATRAVLAQLSDEERWILLLADLEQRSVDEIGELLGTKTSATKMRISRARSRFRTLYGEMIESHGAGR